MQLATEVQGLLALPAATAANAPALTCALLTCDCIGVAVSSTGKRCQSAGFFNIPLNNWQRRIIANGQLQYALAVCSKWYKGTLEEASSTFAEQAHGRGGRLQGTSNNLCYKLASEENAAAQARDRGGAAAGGSGERRRARRGRAAEALCAQPAEHAADQPCTGALQALRACQLACWQTLLAPLPASGTHTVCLTRDLVVSCDSVDYPCAEGRRGPMWWPFCNLCSVFLDALKTLKSHQS